MPDGLSKEETQQAVEKGIERFLDKKFAEFGKWSFYGIAALVLGALIAFIIWTGGLK
jgi:hypothetical protein